MTSTISTTATPQDRVPYWWKEPLLVSLPGLPLPAWEDRWHQQHRGLSPPGRGSVRDHLDLFRSSCSDGNEGDSCAEVTTTRATTHATIHVRDSKVTGGPVFQVAVTAWTDFVTHASGSRRQARQHRPHHGKQRDRECAACHQDAKRLHGPALGRRPIRLRRSESRRRGQRGHRCSGPTPEHFLQRHRHPGRAGETETLLLGGLRAPFLGATDGILSATELRRPVPAEQFHRSTAQNLERAGRRFARRLHRPCAARSPAFRWGLARTRSATAHTLPTRAAGNDLSRRGKRSV